MSKKKLVVLTGAGISAESGLRTFRDSDGLWEGYNIEDVATPRAWKKDPQLVLDFYNYRRKNVLDAKPNAAHYGLAELEKDFDVTIITQNIDDLHERAGSTNVMHLHGEILKMRSERRLDLIYELFVVVGTSLVVYPAAGLLTVADDSIPKFIVDKKIPYTSSVHNLTAIEKPATEGVKELISILTDKNIFLWK